MRCEDVREHVDELWAGEVTEEIRMHLAACPACARYAREVRQVQSGLRLLAQDPGPEPTLGFAARLVRRLAESAQGNAREQFFERVGRRFVFATLVLAMFLVLALVAPATGPVRAAASADLLMAEQEEAIVRPDLVGSAWQESQTVTPPEVPPTAEGGSKNQK